MLCAGLDSLAFYFVNQGYDLWINNTRGNKFSREHRYLCPNANEEYWDFSFDEFAAFDMPALFDFVESQTAQKKVAYVGHSQGTQQMFAGLCENGEYWRPRLNCAIMLGPVARIDRMNNPLTIYLMQQNWAKTIYRLRGVEIDSKAYVSGRLTARLFGLIQDPGTRLISDEDT